MLKKLTAEGRFECGIDEVLAGKVWAFTATLSKDCGDGCFVGLGAAVANERGYVPIPSHWVRSDSYDEMSDHADELNLAMGLDYDAATKIIISSMAKGVKR